MSVTKYDAERGIRWQVDVWLDYPNGSRRRLRKRNIPTREMALALERKAQTEAFEGRFFETRRVKNPTIEEVWEAYEPVTRQRNDSWQSDTGRAKHLLRHWATREVNELTRQDVEGYISKRLTEISKRTGRPPRPSSVNRELSLARRMISYSVECEKIAKNPLLGFQKLKENNIRQQVVSEDEFARLLKNAEPPLGQMLKLAFEYGMRKGEILQLKRSRVDFKNGVIRLAPEDTKTDEARIIHLSENTRAMLADLPVSMSGFLLVNPETGKPWVEVRRLFGRACKGAEVTGVWFHDLRRSFVTNARRRGIPESVVMKMSGHRTREVFDRYNVIGEEDLVRARALFEEKRREELAENDKTVQDECLVKIWTK